MGPAGPIAGRTRYLPLIPESEEFFCTSPSSLVAVVELLLDLNLIVFNSRNQNKRYSLLSNVELLLVVPMHQLEEIASVTTASSVSREESMAVGGGP